MDLFLRVSSQKSDNDIKDDSVGLEHEKPKRKFEDLFKFGMTRVTYSSRNPFTKKVLDRSENSVILLIEQMKQT